MSEHSANFETAPAWNKERALAKFSFLSLADKSMKELEPVRGKTGALKSFLHHFNNHFLGADIKAKLRRGKIHQATFYRWLQAYEKYGLDGLLERHHGSGPRIDSEVKDGIEALIIKNHLAQYRDIFNDLHLLITDKAKIPSYSTVKAYAKRYRKDNWASLVLMHEGKKGLRKRHMELALGRKDENITRPNQRWEIDTTVADVMTKREGSTLITKDGKRCKIIAIMDVFSRSVKFLVTDKEDSFAVGQLIKQAILEWGIPEELVIDNGRPFKNRRILRFLKSLGISVNICLPGEPVLKPFIERNFRTLSDQLLRRLPGYTGNCIETRPDEIEVELTMAELQEIINRWVASIYDEKSHGGTGQRPRERRNLPGFERKTVDERALDILLMQEFSRTVTQGHIRYLGHRYYHKRLPDGQKVKFRVDDSDASQLLVYYQGQFLCAATDFSLKGIKPSEIREARKERNGELRTRIKAHKALLNKYDQVETGILAQIDAAEKKKPLSFPRKTEVVDFPELREAAKEEPALESEETPITSPDAKYMDIMRRKNRGEPLSEFDSKWLKRFIEDDDYQQIKPALDAQLREEMEAANA